MERKRGGEMAEWRRFILIGTEEDEKKLNQLLKGKNITRADLVLILKTLKLNPDISPECY